MPGYTSAAEMARAKRMHKCEIGASSPARTSPASSAAPSPAASVTPRRSHADFEITKRRHLTDITSSPRREVNETPREPAVYGHTHGAMAGPPYHKSCREFAHEKTEHLTPMLPSRNAAKSSTGGGCQHTSPSKCTSNEAFSDKKRKHNHELDSCSPRRAAAEAAAAAAEASAAAAAGAEGAGAEGAAAAPEKAHNHCTSAERFRASKMMHAHGMDECHEKPAEIYNGGMPDTPKCSSSELFRKEKALHRHGIDECKSKTEPEPEPEHTGRCKSVDRFSKEKRAHRHAIDQCCPKHVIAPEPEAEGPAGSQNKLQKLKRNHDHSIEASPPRANPLPAAEDPTKSKRSCKALTASKKKHSKDMSTAGRPSSKPLHCVSNEEYAVDKKKHRHMVDSCRGCSPQGTMYSKTEEHADGQCLSLSRMNTAKRRHDHVMDKHKSGSMSPDGGCGAPEEGGRCPSPKCKSNSEFTAKKRHHSHEMDECSPAREAKAAEAHDHAVCTSNQSFSRDKRSHKHPIDACRTPRRELFDTSEPPVITATKIPEPEATPATPASAAAEPAEQ